MKQLVQPHGPRHVEPLVDGLRPGGNQHAFSLAFGVRVEREHLMVHQGLRQIERNDLRRLELHGLRYLLRRIHPREREIARRYSVARK